MHDNNNESATWKNEKKSTTAVTATVDGTIKQNYHQQKYCSLQYDVWVWVDFNAVKKNWKKLTNKRHTHIASLIIIIITSLSNLGLSAHENYHEIIIKGDWVKKRNFSYGIFIIICFRSGAWFWWFFFCEAKTLNQNETASVCLVFVFFFTCKTAATCL